ncbi:hypothetical protein [Pseudoblastomonas halimionae]|uniref:Uncharacterized protein n=1 Tax=Alteriqipengyuania halimionae TaxID=1926630 RepID=A0A6I4TYC1_9SPHN|nr:hypothetical protein [Alteriqipengyuania halimionae]MXP08576.1 hypothetical protein [Alteriqipengyuania halimionae]
MPKLIRYALLPLLIAACAPEAGSVEAHDFPRLVPEPVQRDGQPTTLVGWHDASTPYSQNRILPDDPSFAGAVMLTVGDVAVDFDRGLVEALAHEGVSEPTVVARRDLTGTIPETFSTAIDNPRGRYSTFVADAVGPDGPVRIAGLWLQSPVDDEPGSTFEMFIAPRDTFEAMGGWFVPTARYFDISFVDPAEVDLTRHGTLPPEEAAQKIAEHFGELMSFILQSQALMSAMTQQTLSIQQGLDQVEPRGLQDPMYKP